MNGSKQPKFDKTYCSQCGQEFGPGDHGYSHCSSHKKNFDFNAARSGYRKEALRRVRDGADPLTSRKVPKGKVKESCLSFKTFLGIMEAVEDGDITALQQKIAMLDVEMQKLIEPKLKMKQVLTKQLAVMQKQAAATKPKVGQQNPMQAGSQTTTPGGTGAATPGQG